MKKLLALLLTLSMLVLLPACGKTEPAVTTPAVTDADTGATEDPFKPADYTVMTLQGPTGMGLAKLMDDAAKGTSANRYTFTLTGDSSAVTAAVIKGEADIACVPVNLASVLYNKTNGDYVCLAINTLGVLHILEAGDTVHSVADLAGKTLYATGQGSTPEYILNYILEKNGISDKVNVVYKTEHAELATLLASGEVSLGMLPEPNVTSAKMKNADLRQALDLAAEWDKVCGTSAVQGCVIVKKSVAEANPLALTVFAEEYAASVAFVNEKTAQAAAMCETYGIVPKAAVAAAAYPNCNIVFIEGAEMKAALSAFLEILYAANPSSVGEKLPDDAFYLHAEN